MIASILLDHGEGVSSPSGIAPSGQLVCHLLVVLVWAAG